MTTTTVPVLLVFPSIPEVKSPVVDPNAISATTEALTNVVPTSVSVDDYRPMIWPTVPTDVLRIDPVPSPSALPIIPKPSQEPGTVGYLREFNELAQRLSDSESRGAARPAGSLPVQQSGKSAFVYVDQNNNGEPDATEQTVAAVTVGVRHPDGHLVIVRTDINGQFSFADVPDGTYALSLVEGLPAEFSISPNWASKTITVAGQFIVEDVGFPVTARSEPDQLALTGASIDTIGMLAFLALLSGLLVLFAARRRKTPSSRDWRPGPFTGRKRG